MGLVTRLESGAVVIGGRSYPTAFAAQYQVGKAARKVRNPFKKMLFWAILLELREMP